MGAGIGDGVEDGINFGDGMDVTGGASVLLE
jgi:hypothetical protein